MAKELMDEMTYVLKRGVVNGPTLYGAQKLVAFSDVAASNVLPRTLPQEARTPLVGLALATLPLMLSDHWFAEKMSEYTMASAVAQTIALAGNKGSGMPGPIDQAVNKVFAPIATIGAPSAGQIQSGYATNGFPLRGGFPMRGYIPSATRGYIPSATRGYVGGMGNLNPLMQRRLRGMTTL